MIKLGKFTPLLFLLGFSFYTSIAQDLPSGEISGDTVICENGNINLKIKFNGKAPYGFWMEETTSGNSYYNTDGIFENELVDGYYIESIRVDKNSTFKLIEVYDDFILDWSKGNGFTNVSGEANIIVDMKPKPDAGTDIVDHCGYSIELNATPENFSHPYYWSPSASGNYSDSSDPQATFTSHTAGTSTLYFVEESGVCKDSSSVSVSLLGSPSANLSGLTTICSTDGDAHTIDAEILFTGRVPYSYTISDGINDLIEIKDIDTPSHIITLPATGNQIYKIIELRDQRNGKQCYADESDLVGRAEVKDMKPDANPGIQSRVCDDNTSLGASLTEGATGLWSTSSDNVIIETQTDPTSKVTVLDYGEYTFTWTENRDGCYHSNDVKHRFSQSPRLTLLSNDTAICRGTSASMQLQLEGHAPWVLEYHDGSVTSETDIPDSPANVYLAPDETTIYTLTGVTGYYGCNTFLNDITYQVTVDAVPSANAGTYDDAYCGNSVMLNAISSMEGSIGFWEGQGEFDDSTATNTNFSAYNYGSNTLIWTERNGINRNCSSSDEVNIRFDKLPEEVFAGDDQMLYLQFSSYLKALEPDAGLGHWSVIEGTPHIISPDNPLSPIEDLKMGEQVLKWTVTNGVCESKSDNVTIEVKGLLNATGFSPNGDGVNDFFLIKGAEHIVNNELKVFDEWGNIVYSKKKYTNDWDGTFNDGTKVKDGTYYYVFMGDDITPVKDFVVIKRSSY
ncbi:gliding motility-associated C-terminal domain-containing protein [Marinilabiliaceae bacterium JC017]|nr:gliding motility-associated C-terminal domain-containing protein [Marinilabiliaceae bacterium JC017]